MGTYSARLMHSVYLKKGLISRGSDGSAVHCIRSMMRSWVFISMFKPGVAFDVSAVLVILLLVAELRAFSSAFSALASSFTILAFSRLSLLLVAFRSAFSALASSFKEVMVAFSTLRLLFVAELVAFSSAFSAVASSFMETIFAFSRTRLLLVAFSSAFSRAVCREPKSVKNA